MENIDPNYQQPLTQEDHEQHQEQQSGVVANSNQIMTYGFTSPNRFALPSLTFHNQPQHFFSASHQQQQVQAFWTNQIHDIGLSCEFRNHSLPLARIKKIMKSDEDVRMISAEAPIIFAKACELFVMDLTARAWIHTEENKRRTLQKNDVIAAIVRTDVFDFLVDILPRDEPAGGIPMLGGLPAAAEDFSPYYYVAPTTPPRMGGGRMVFGKPDDVFRSQAAHQHALPLQFLAWGQPEDGMEDEEPPAAVVDGDETEESSDEST
ncbi:nuclear transcription factor Y subunit C-2-like [Andrographis paniculata]|uniref:nuclear transcription factor Y subunit C-2-like n=1 Tax=Andrographis paniculata TaxID=175694 RepID=UPI0021E8F3C0|nr:nuclear transcription factor Y subunit C-2-like [Andrographis paniculata]XP_051128816.1 nuclear transcription factor Y subunit C-2-like [Andrographis paniculata]XP_051128817.1 nuclear transcription factor Y subunit C-2-like [Andrographis paniculata]